MNERDRVSSRRAVLILTAGMVAVMLLAGGAISRPTPVQSQSQPNIIFIVVDALRADHVSAYGYRRPTTPNLDAFMANGARFAEATTASSWTYPSNAAMLSGRMPSRMDIKDWGSFASTVPASELLLAEALKGGGYRTVGFVSNFYLWPQFGLNQGFDHYERLSGTELAEELNRKAFTWLDANRPTLRERPLFLFMYYYDPHTWYDPPPPYDKRYDPNYGGTLTPEVYGHGEKVVSGEIVPSARDVQHLLALYDGEITYWDYHLGRFLERLAAEGLLTNALVVVTSDHGQMFGEHGKWVHRNSLYEEVLRVPLFMRYPGVIPTGRTITAPVTTADLMPTVLDLVGLPVPGGLDGRSLKPILQGSQPPRRSIYAEMDAEPNPSSPGHWIAPPYDLRSVKDDGWKYIHQVNRPSGHELYRVQPNTQFEEMNLITDYPQIAGGYRQQTMDFFRLPTFFNYAPTLRRR